LLAERPDRAAASTLQAVLVVPATAIIGKPLLAAAKLVGSAADCLIGMPDRRKTVLTAFVEAPRRALPAAASAVPTAEVGTAVRVRDAVVSLADAPARGRL
jgi:hypothetical protein